MKRTENENDAVMEFMNNLGTPNELAEKYNVDIDRLRELIEYEIELQILKIKK